METRSKGGKGVSLGLLVLVVLMAVPIWATPVDLDIYSDTTIANGEYDKVNIYDTPPDQTSVDMTGGHIAQCSLYDTAILNYLNGDIVWLVAHENSIINIHSDYDYGFALYDSSEAHLHNGCSDFDILVDPRDAQLHIYGYNLTCVQDISSYIVAGLWEDSRETFNMRVRGGGTPQIVLHEIPEPTIVMLLAFGTIFLRRSRK